MNSHTGEKTSREDFSLAEERNILARERTLLANERTFSAWIRTGLAALASGLGIAHLLDTPEQQLISRSIGIILVLLGGGMFAFASWRYRREMRKTGQYVAGIIPATLLNTLTAGLLITAVLALFLIR